MRPVPVALGLLVCASLTAVPPAGAAPMLCDGRVATIVGTAADDALTGTAGPDVVAGLAGDDTLTGLDGDDVLCGDDGADTLVGGAGHDRLLGGRDAVSGGVQGLVREGSDTARPGPGDDFVDLGDDPRDPLTDLPGELLDYGDVGHGILLDLAAGTAVADGVDTIVVADVLRVVGTPYADTMRGSALADWLCAGAGDDVLAGGAGDDLLDADGSLGADCDLDEYPYPTASGDDAVRGGPGDDLVVGGGGADDVRGEGGGDVLGAGPRSTAVLVGGPGADTVGLKVDRAGGVDVRAGAGRDSLVVGRSRAWRRRSHRVDLTVDLRGGRLASGGRLVARIDGFAHLLVARGSNDAWTIVGTPGRNRIDAAFARGPVHARGLAGNDVLVGGRSDDVLDAGPGDDRIDGLRGFDTCADGERLAHCEHRS